jgi:hypothetical protein
MANIQSAEKEELIRIIDFLENLQRTCDDDDFDLIKSIVNDLEILFVSMYPDSEEEEE